MINKYIVFFENERSNQKHRFGKIIFSNIPIDIYVWSTDIPHPGSASQHEPEQEAVHSNRVGNSRYAHANIELM